WRDRFLGNIAGANLKLGDPEVILSNDGFPYVQLQTVKNDESAQAYVIEHQLEVLLEQGIGVVVNAHLEQPDWVFSYGDLVNLKQCGSYYTDKSFFSNPKQYNSIGQDEDILVGQPSEEDRKSTRLNSSHVKISYAVFCLKKKTTKTVED